MMLFEQLADLARKGFSHGFVVPGSGLYGIRQRASHKLEGYVPDLDEVREFIETTSGKTALNGEMRYVCSFSEMLFRVDVIPSEEGPCLSIRIIAGQASELDDIPMCEAARALVASEKGLVIVSGPPASGKTTVLEALVGYLMRRPGGPIAVIQGPCEFRVRSGVRPLVYLDPRRVNIAHMCPGTLVVDGDLSSGDLELVLNCAENGIPVVISEVSPDTAGALRRFSSRMGVNQETRTRETLAKVLTGVVALAPKLAGERYILLTEILVATQPVKNLIREGRFDEARDNIFSGYKFGMRTFEESEADLIRSGIIS